MTFQATVQIQMGFGVPGEVYQSAPWVILPYTLNSGAQLNVVGSTAYTITAEGLAQAGAGGTLGFGGILCSPKDYASFGAGNAPLAPTLQLPNFTEASLLSEGIMVVSLPAVASIGDYVIYNDVTGTLATMPPGDFLPVGFSFANAVVSQFNQTSASGGLAVIQVKPVVYPVPVDAP
jgi:hypothetical protein